MDQSLESIIKSKQHERKQSKNVRKPVSKKVFKSSGANDHNIRRTTQVINNSAKAKLIVRREEPKSSSSIFERLGSAKASNAQLGGTKVLISGLTKSVSRTDVTQLCESIGEVKNVHKKVDSAEVVFAKRSDAITAIKKFNGLTLDGEPMKVVLFGEGGKANPFDPNADEEDNNSDHDNGERRSNNVREGFFGTRGEFSSEAQSSGGINFGYKKAPEERRVSRDSRVTVTISNREDDSRGGRGSGGRGGGGKGRGGGRGGGKGGKGGRREQSEPKSAADLDKEMDDFFASR